MLKWSDHDILVEKFEEFNALNEISSLVVNNFEFGEFGFGEYRHELVLKSLYEEISKIMASDFKTKLAAYNYFDSKINSVNESDIPYNLLGLISHYNFGNLLNSYLNNGITQIILNRAIDSLHENVDYNIFFKDEIKEVMGNSYDLILDGYQKMAEMVNKTSIGYDQDERIKTIGYMKEQKNNAIEYIMGDVIEKTGDKKDDKIPYEDRGLYIDKLYTNITKDEINKINEMIAKKVNEMANTDITYYEAIKSLDYIERIFEVIPSNEFEEFFNGEYSIDSNLSDEKKHNF